MVTIIFKLNVVVKQTTWSDSDNWSIDDEDIFGKLVAHDKKLKLKNSNNGRPKSHDVSPPIDLQFFSYKATITSSVKSSNKNLFQDLKAVIILLLLLDQ